MKFRKHIFSSNHYRILFREEEHCQPAPARSGASVVLHLALTTLCGTRKSGNDPSPQALAANVMAMPPPARPCKGEKKS